MRLTLIIAALALTACNKTYRVTHDANGHIYVLDHGLSAQDCLDRIDGFGSAVRCERES